MADTDHTDVEDASASRPPDRSIAISALSQGFAHPDDVDVQDRGHGKTPPQTDKFGGANTFSAQGGAERYRIRY